MKIKTKKTFLQQELYDGKKNALFSFHMKRIPITFIYKKNRRKKKTIEKTQKTQLKSKEEKTFSYCKNLRFDNSFHSIKMDSYNFHLMGMNLN